MPNLRPAGRALATSALLLLAVSACQDVTPLQPARTASSAKLGVAASASAAIPESAKLRRQDALALELARGIAGALSEPALRSELKRALRAARHSEHKIDLRRYLASPEGARFASAVGAQTERSGFRLGELLDSLPAIEAYLPVRDHRAAWRGGRELIVAAGLHEREAPRGFTVDGTEVALSGSAAPAQPVLILTTVETDFERPLDTNLWENVEDGGGAAIGTMVPRASRPKEHSTRPSSSSTVSPMLVEPCTSNTYASTPNAPPPPDDCEPDIPPYPVYPTRGPGIWLDQVDVNDVEEPWYRGTPEVQLVLTGPGMNGFEGPRLSCSGQYAKTQAQNNSDWKYFDQGGTSWTRKPELLEGLLFGQTDLDQFGSIYQDNVPVSIELWEDDTGGENCGFHGSHTDVQEFANDLTNAYHVVSQIIRILRPTLGGSPVSIGISLAMSIRTLLGSGDDLLLGRAIPVQLNDGSFSQREFRLVRATYNIMGRYAGMQDNGRILVTIIQPPVS